MTKRSAPRWTQIKRCYLSGKGTVQSIATKYGVARRTISARARREGWPRRRNALGEPLTIRQRLFNAVDEQLARVEERLAVEEPISAADSERLAREIGMIVKNYDKVEPAVAAEPQGKGGAPATPANPNPGTDDAERWRLELADRIGKLRQRIAAR